MLRGTSTSDVALGSLLTTEENGAEREEILDLLFEHATGTRLSRVRSAEELARLHADASRRLGSDLAGGVAHLAEAYAALMRDAAGDYGRGVSAAVRVLAETTARRRSDDPFGAATSSAYLGVALDLTDRTGLALDAYEDAYALYQAAEFRAVKARDDVGLVSRFLATRSFLGAVVHSGGFYHALWRWCDAAERITRGRALVRPALTRRRPAAVGRIDYMAATATRRKDAGLCMLCGQPMGLLARTRYGTIHRACTTFRR
jgi:hypothetical protein